MKQLNVQFIKAMVLAHSCARVALSKVYVVSVECIFSPVWTLIGMEKTTTQATASKLEIFFKENVFSFQVIFFCFYDFS
jgi:hypothetical protein